ncbi:hypothetical protein D9758_015519 [Tetrapyrgos nigripes]|uniref:Uncharacterized protein n=1 Tax=Tetrapyrgos nigripes TaxID=182062 RepID=A0A8H5FUE1_9AGAR|nr:hypothetical protein D9758_015519 [Tetrapyrgos nigripes]
MWGLWSEDDVGVGLQVDMLSSPFEFEAFFQLTDLKTWSTRTALIQGAF